MRRRKTTEAIWEGSQILVGDALECLRKLPNGIPHTCVTSPPYWGLRNYGVEGQLGVESTPEEYVEKLVHVFREVRRVLRDDGTLWVNLGDSYAGSMRGPPGKTSIRSRTMDAQYCKIDKSGHGLKSKDLVGIPWRVAFALQADGWYLRSDIIWAKPNPMPESITDRPSRAHEFIFLLSKSERYYYDVDAVREKFADSRRGSPGGKKPRERGIGRCARPPQFWIAPSDRTGRNLRSVWVVPPQPYAGLHFAVFPPKLIEPCVKAGVPLGGLVLDPFFGTGTTGEVAIMYARRFIGIELNPAYVKLAKERLSKVECCFSRAVKPVREALGIGIEDA